MIALKVMKILIPLFLSQMAWSALTLSDISGISQKTIASDGAWTIYGGIQFNKDEGDFGCSVGEICNTCQGVTAAANQDLPCNLNGAFETTVITFSATTTATTGKWLLCDGTDQVKATTDLTTSISLTWGDVCNASSSGNTTCSTNISETLTFGAAADCNALSSAAATEKVTINVRTRKIEVLTYTAGEHTYTPPSPINPLDPASCSTTNGFCYFDLFPGDEKIYLNDVTFYSVSTGVSNVNYSNLLFFYEETGTIGDDSTNDVATFGAISTNSDYAVIALGSAGEVSPDATIGPLSNDVRYCFKMAHQDAAGNIDRISSSDCTVAGAYDDLNADCRHVCTSPSEVVGLLNDKSCFIATAAFGSSLDEHVERLRQFKKEFLAPSWLGRKFIKLYYQISPPVAEWISRHEWARSTTRAFLWPVLGWVELSFLWGWWGVFLPSFLVLFGFLIYRRRVLT